MTQGNEGFSGKSFQTAATRRKGEPIRFQVEHDVYDPDTDTVTHLAYVLRVDPNLDMVRFGSALGAFTELMAAAQKANKAEQDAVAAGGDGEAAQLDRGMSTMEVLEREHPKVMKAIRGWLVPPDRARFDEVAEGVSPTMASEIIQHISHELSGLDPTERPSSSDGSPPSSPSLTVGVPPVD